VTEVTLAMFYILFIVMYHNEVQKRNKIELYNTILSMQLAKTSNDIQNVKTSQEMSRIYRHDLRHHLSLLYGFAESGNIYKVKDYLLQTKKDLYNITPIIFCENDIVNIVLSFFDNKAKRLCNIWNWGKYLYTKSNIAIVILGMKNQVIPFSMMSTL